jgi:hypothetical protein
MNSGNLNRIPYYNSWIGLSVFVLILIFQPGKFTFFAIRPSDVWLWYCLFLQLKNGYNITLPFKNRFLIKNYGLFMGVLAIISTLIQASYANISLESSFVFQFYRFLRFLLIFKFVENILSNFTSDDSHKFWRIYTLMGLIVLVLSFLEFYDIKSFKLLMINLYYERPEDTIEAYLNMSERLAGVLGNPNSTAILLVTTLTYPLLRIGIGGSILIKRILYSIYILAIIYVLLVLTGSRTTIFILLIVFSFILIATSRRLKEVLLYLILTLIMTGTGLYLYQRFKSNIEVQGRITEAIHGENFQLSEKGIAEWTGRDEMWQNRFRTFNSVGNQLAILVGLGYTKAYYDYADNGLLNTFINNGLIGLILKLFLFYFFIKYGFFRSIGYYIHFKIDYFNLAFALSALSLLLMESTIDLTDHYKLGQLFYFFLSITMVINGKIFSKNNQ